MRKTKKKIQKASKGLQDVVVPQGGEGALGVLGQATSLASSGAAIAGPWGAAAGAIAGGALGLYKHNQAEQAKKAAENLNKQKAQMRKYDGVDETINQATQEFKQGTSNMKNSKPIEVEKDELIFKKVGKNFVLKADFKGGKTHAQGGEPYVAKEGDVIFPGKQRKKVLSAYKEGNNARLETMRQMLPKDTNPKGEARQGMDNTQGNDWPTYGTKDKTGKWVKVGDNWESLETGMVYRPDGSVYDPNTKKLGTYTTKDGKYTTTWDNGNETNSTNTETSSPTTSQTSRPAWMKDEGLLPYIYDGGSAVGSGLYSLGSGLGRGLKNFAHGNTMEDNPTEQTRNAAKSKGLGASSSSWDTPVDETVSALKNSTTGSTTTTNNTAINNGGSGNQASGKTGGGGSGRGRNNTTTNKEEKKNPLTKDSGLLFTDTKYGKMFQDPIKNFTQSGVNVSKESLTKTVNDVKPSKVELNKTSLNTPDLTLSQKAGVKAYRAGEAIKGIDTNNVLKYAGVANNIIESLKKPDKVEENYLEPEKLTYKDRSHSARKEVDSIVNTAVRNSSQSSAGNAQNARANATQARLAGLTQKEQINEREQTKADAIDNMNLQAKNQANQTNVMLRNQYAQQRAGNEAAAGNFRGQAMADVAGLAQMNRQEKYMKELDAKKNDMDMKSLGIAMNMFKDFTVKKNLEGGILHNSQVSKEKDTYKKGTRKIKIKPTSKKKK